MHNFSKNKRIRNFIIFRIVIFIINEILESIGNNNKIMSLDSFIYHFQFYSLIFDQTLIKNVIVNYLGY